MDKNSVNNEINFFGETTFRNQRKKFGIKTDDRRRHVYAIGKTGVGKTVMLKNMAIQDIQQGKGIGFIDPHGEAAEELLDFIPSDRINDVVYFNPADLDFPIAFNIVEKVNVEHRHLVASGLMGVFKKIWPDVWSARMEYILNNSILALLEYPGSTLLGVNRMLADPAYRKKIVDKVTDPVIKSFWVQEFARYTQRYEVEATAAIQNKVGQFISNPLIRNIIGQVKSSVDMRKIMDEKKILIVNISKGRIGEDNSRLLGALLITKLQLAVMSRVDIPEEKRQDFFLYVDEFQNFATQSFTNILSEARKYRLSLILGHQYITQMEEEVRDAVFGNVGTIVVFRVGAEDAEYLEKEFAPEFVAEDLVNLPKYNIDLKLMIDGVAGSAFSAETLSPLPKLEESNREKIIKASRERYSIPRKIVEEKIAKWTGTSNLPEAPLQESRQVLYDAKCSLCGKWTKVIFPPDASRPVYCKTCLKKVRDERGSVPQQTEVQGKKETSPTRAAAKGEEEDLSSSPALSLQEAIDKEPVSFSGKKEVEKSKEEKERKRKEVNLEELKKTLEESLREIKPEKEDEGFKKV
ncbi:MAG: hypothetical protein COS25_02610 [Candidatus Nealsonbacteria bacterium CG02_land_8_20_14_3_00_37_10]|uniref:Uncharacterized protein n=1 Tax=Candidatus Nealsonbacteria bacterium CG02_land_8_20_14_3_00_37_10 TaxID=1974699 RepID=A0A2M7D937_9BACT|nr:MAG: hypothetical protein COS25_02610 [Candidatus Nealsonbacteria bacterium CG02_land_8_20_14_3_00_37_10]